MTRAEYLVIDTETSGLFQFKDKLTGKPIPADDPCQPRLAALALIWADAEGNALRNEKLYVRPEGWLMDPAAAAVNGLTDEFLLDHGRPIEEVLDVYTREVSMGRIVAAFNAQFDCKMMRGELRRAGRDDLFAITRNTCLMRAMGKLGHMGFKSATRGWPKLVEATEFFGHVVENPHDPLSDAEGARVVLQNLIRIGAVIPPKVHHARVAPDHATA